MTTRQPPIPSRRSGRRDGVVAGVVCCMLLVLLATQWLGCSSSPEERYKVLSFFFDGVPDPNASKVSETDEFGERTTVARTGSVHKPFAENKCDACHASATGKFEDFDKVDVSACAKCHQETRTQYAYMHGPVATGECRLCHSPHESSVKFLMNDASPALCVSCHDAEFLPQNIDHEISRDCLECHVGHGGEKRMLLRADWRAKSKAATQPASQPATMPDGGRP